MGGFHGRLHVACRPVTPERWEDLEALFGERGACGGCWCMAWRLSHGDWKAGKGASNRAALRRLVAAGALPGILAYLGTDPVGWCSVAPRSAFRFLERSRLLRPIDDREVWSVSCLFIDRAHRRRGISVALLRAAADLAARRGASLLEGYPVEPAGGLPDAFVWTGLPAAFRRAGFREVARRSPVRPVFRRRLRPGQPGRYLGWP